MRILSWNIRQGGGRRLGDIVAAIRGYEPDAVVLNEVRARTASALCEELSRAGLAFQEHTDPCGFESGTLVAARKPLRRLPRHGPSKILPHGLLEVELHDECVIGAVYGPMVTPKHRPFWNRLVRHATANVSASYLLIGDFNTCEAGVDAYKKPLAGSEQFIAIREAGYVDLWRRTNSAMEYTWFSFGRQPGEVAALVVGRQLEAERVIVAVIAVVEAIDHDEVHDRVAPVDGGAWTPVAVDAHDRVDAAVAV